VYQLSLLIGTGISQHDIEIGMPTVNLFQVHYWPVAVALAVAVVLLLMP